MINDYTRIHRTANVKETSLVVIVDILITLIGLIKRTFERLCVCILSMTSLMLWTGLVE